MLFAESAKKSFGRLDVLKDVSFTVGKGERVGLVGPNGAGKTTLLRCISGDEAVDGGAAGVRGGRDSSVGYLYSNWEDEGVMRPAEVPKLTARSAGCSDWVGTATVTTEDTVPGGHAVVTLDAQVRFKNDNPPRHDHVRRPGHAADRL